MEIKTYEDVPYDDWLVFLQKAKDIGMPASQIQNFIDRYYLPLPWQMKFHAEARRADIPGEAVKIGAGGSRGPGKSHAVFAQIAIDDCQRYPGLKGLFLRQTGKSAQESFEDLINKVILNKMKYKYNSSKGTLKFDNSSKIILGGFENERDIDRYVGIEYDVIGVEELNQLTEAKVEKLEGSLRTSKPNWRPRMYTSFNPGGIGHSYVKKTYIIPHRMNDEKKTKFIAARYKDNPYLNPEYIDYLEGLTGDLGKAWRDGEWDIFAGQMFEEWREKLHTCYPFMPAKLSSGEMANVIIGGMDWGRTKPFSFHLAEVSQVAMPSGVKFYRVKPFLEVYGTNKSPAEWWEDKIKNTMEFYKVDVKSIAWIQADPKIFVKGDDTSISIRDQFINADSEFGYKIKPASNDRIGGWSVYHNWLRVAPDGLPYYIVSTDCKNLIRTLPELQHDELRVEDVDTENEDHAPDDQRYMLKKVKWIDAGVGAAIHPQPGDKKIPLAPQFIPVGDEMKQVSINIDRFAKPKEDTTGEVGAVERI